MSYSFRLAATPADFEQIRLLNHQVFSEELGQHSVRADGVLPDPFEARSHYLVSLHEDLVIGMVCFHDDPPWSVTKRLAEAASLDELPHPLLEVRLLALAKAHRNHLAVAGLLAGVFEYAVAGGYRTLLISGVTEQVKMYRRLGFIAIGPAVAEGQVAFYPMALDLNALPAHTLEAWRRYQRRIS